MAMLVYRSVDCPIGGFKHFLFSSLPGEMIKFDECFSNGLKPPTSCIFTVAFPIHVW